MYLIIFADKYRNYFRFRVQHRNLNSRNILSILSGFRSLIRNFWQSS